MKTVTITTTTTVTEDGKSETRVDVTTKNDAVDRIAEEMANPSSRLHKALAKQFGIKRRV